MGTRFKGSARQVKALCAYINLIRASDSVESRVHRHLRQARLSPSQMGVLEALLHCGQMCQCDLGQKLLKSGANITLVVDNLEKQGLVERKRSKEDRRFVSVALTREGRALVERIFPAHAEAITREFQALSSAEQEELRRLCRKLGRQGATDE